MRGVLRQQNPEFVRKTFSDVSDRYDLANRVLSGCSDWFWRRRAARLVARTGPRSVLDLATGSGDLALAIREICPEAVVVGADFCGPMLEKSRQKGAGNLVLADALKLPFAGEEFDVVTVAFGLRNMACWELALQEMHRVLAPGGRLFVMDFAMPEVPGFRWLYRIYLRGVLPVIAGWLTGHPEAYEYLGESIELFPRWGDMVKLLRSCGFEGIQQEALGFGIAAIYQAVKP